jgi:hypothetical protein
VINAGIVEPLVHILSRVGTFDTDEVGSVIKPQVCFRVISRLKRRQSGQLLTSPQVAQLNRCVARLLPVV